MWCKGILLCQMPPCIFNCFIATKAIVTKYISNQNRGLLISIIEISSTSIQAFDRTCVTLFLLSSIVAHKVLEKLEEMAIKAD